LSAPQLLAFFLSASFSLLRWFPDGLGLATVFDAASPLIALSFSMIGVVSLLGVVVRSGASRRISFLVALISASLGIAYWKSGSVVRGVALPEASGTTQLVNKWLRVTKNSHCNREAQFQRQLGNSVICSALLPFREVSVFDSKFDGEGSGKSRVLYFSNGSETVGVGIIDQEGLKDPMERRASVQRVGTLLRNFEGKVIVLIHWRVTPLGPSRKKLTQLLKVYPLTGATPFKAYLPKYRVDLFGRLKALRY
jgi:hypothetical protein